ncbi:MAG: hypothetical protein JNK54_05690 [Elusimicrobia bacterium]|jgi:hypothetical protein|nr:hypothetical protein [Elusimicrobiota bacterium]
MKKYDSPKMPSAPGVAPLTAPWRPTWRWHLKALVGIYVFCAIFYLAVDRWLSSLPEPYALRDIPVELTPWLKK